MMTRTSELRWAAACAVLAAITAAMAIYAAMHRDWFFCFTYAGHTLLQAYWCRFSLRRSRTLP